MFRIALLAALGAALAAGAADAAPRQSLGMVRVAYGDLDLASPTGARTMLHRLTVAAKALCVDHHTPVFPGEGGRVDRCRKEAISSAVERLNQPQLRMAFAEVLAEP